MKVLQAIETSGPGGAEQVLIRLCVSLRERGHDVRAVLLKPGWLEDRLLAERIPVERLVLRRPLDFGLARGLAALAATSGADLVHAHEFTFAFYGRLAGLRRRLPLVATAHGANFVEGAKRRLLGAASLRPGARFRLVTVSDALAAALAGSLRLPRAKVDVVRNGIDIPSETPVAREPDGGFRLVAVGNLYPVKNHAVLVRAVAALRQAGVPAELDVLGRGAEEAALRAEIARLHLDDCVRLQGFRSDVGAFLARADVFLSGSLSEQMPLSFLEAMVRALPVVATRVGGVPEIVEDGTTGLLFPSDDAVAAAGLLETLWRDPERRRRLGENARTAVLARFSSSAMTDAYLRLYERIVSA